MLKHFIYLSFFSFLFLGTFSCKETPDKTKAATNREVVQPKSTDTENKIPETEEKGSAKTIVKEVVEKPVVYSSAKAMVDATVKKIKNTTVNAVKKDIDAKKDVVIIDVREYSEFEQGHIPGAVTIPRGLIEFLISNPKYWKDQGKKMPSKNQRIFLYCKSGARSALATKSLNALGYTNVYNMKGGMEAWKKQYPKQVTKK